MIVATIGGNPVSVKAGSYNVQKNITDFDTLTITILTFEDAEFYQEGEEVEVFEDEIKIFGGHLHTVDESGALHDYLTHKVQVKGYEYLVNNIIVARAYTDDYTGNIVNSLHADYFHPQGLILGTIEQGIKLNDVKFGYITGLKALQRLAEKSDYILKINENKEINFRSKETNLAPFSLVFDNAIKGSVKVKKGNPKYRNTQYFTGGKAVTNTLTEQFTGDGQNRNFTVGYPVNEAPTVSVSTDGGTTFINKTVGVKNLNEDGSNQFYFNHNDKAITQDRNEDPLAEGDILKVEYEGLYPIVVINKINYEIDSRKKLHGTGEVSKVVNDDLIGIENITNENMRILNHFGTQEGFKITYETWIEGIEPGQLQEVYLPKHNIRGVKALVTSVKIKDFDDRFRYSVTVEYGPGYENWVSFFSKDEEDEDLNLLEGSEFIQPIYEFEKTWTESESPNVFAAKVYPSSTTFPSTTLFPSLAPNEEIRYLAYYINGTETGRVPILSLLKEDDAIFTRAIIGLEVEGTIDKLAWIGGALATSEVGTGFYLDEQDADIEKSGLETIQVEKADLKGW